MRYVLLIFAMALFISSAYAQEYYEIDKEIDLRVICDYNGFCSASSTCNVTVVYPNNTIMINNQLMTNNNAYHNYTISQSQNSVKGIYEVFGECTDGGVSQVFDFDYKVNGNGYPLDTSDSIIYVVYLIGFISVFLLSLYGAIKIPYKNKMNEFGEVIDVNYMKYVKMLCVLNIYVMLLFFSATMRSIFRFFLLYDNLSGYFSWMYSILLAGVYPIIILCGLIFILSIIEDKNAKRILNDLERGVVR